MKRVMLIGDSIRLNYQSVVEEELSGEYSVWAPDENCRFAKYTLTELPRYKVAFSKKENEKTEAAKLTPTIDIKDNLIKPDIIHWNNGLWDTGITYEEEFQEVSGHPAGRGDGAVHLRPRILQPQWLR